jgi:4-amino-4-deoxy-L-arabinose transferase-like glycosyltransferase
LETFFVLVGLWLTLEAGRRESSGAALGAGLALGLAALTRSTWLPALAIAALWLAWHRQAGRPARRQALLLLLAGAAVLAPWAGYNHAVHGEWFVTSTNGGLNFWIGNNPLATGEYFYPKDIDLDIMTTAAALPEVERDRFFYRQGLEFVRAEPAAFLGLCVRRLLYFFLFRPNIGSNYEAVQLPMFWLIGYLFVVPWLMVMPLAALGLARLGQGWRFHLLPIAVFAGQAATSMLYFAGTRFRTPLDGLAILWAIGGATLLLRRWGRPV